MKITHLYVADHHMKWNGIDLEPGDLYGHHDWYGLVYSHVPTYGNYVYFEFVDVDSIDGICVELSDLPMVTPWLTMDGGYCFDGEAEFPEEFMPYVISTKDHWDADIVVTLLNECSEDEEVALYIDGDDAYFFVYPVYSSPDFNQYGECIETWYKCESEVK